MLWLAFVGSDLKIGQSLNCVIEEVKNEGRVVRLSAGKSSSAEGELCFYLWVVFFFIIRF